MAKTYEHRKISLAGYVPPAKLLDKVETLTLDKINFKFTIQNIRNMPFYTSASERWIIVDDNAKEKTGKEILGKKHAWSRTTSFASKYFSEGSIAGHPLSMTFRKESVPEVFAEPAAASSSSETERQLGKPTDFLGI
ncbi:MAG: hypothetical protein KJO21_03960 [Verrucomicrobiae bacterium]|nr:hypothetical protein [Verrucomicrobiae bacterium]NNJ42654.1 hypothetical protein [Akkermansiaceae bacterium]